MYNKFVPRVFSSLGRTEILETRSRFVVVASSKRKSRIKIAAKFWFAISYFFRFRFQISQNVHRTNIYRYSYRGAIKLD